MTSASTDMTGLADAVAPGRAGAGGAVRLILGAAQLGMAYGLANRLGRPDEAQAHAIIGLAWISGVEAFDTAQHYGQSERVLGRGLARLGVSGQAKVVTKLAPSLDPRDDAAVSAALERSRRLLGQERLWGCLLHNAAWLANWRNGPEPALRRALDEGVVANLGVSVYEKAQARQALEAPDVRMIQAPLNAWSADPEWEDILALARQSGRMVFLRSVYLQGLLLLTPEEAAARLPEAGPALRRWRDLARWLDCSPQALALRFAAGFGWPLVVGLESVEQLRENLALAQAAPLSPDERRQVAAAMKPLITERLIDPRRWPAA